MIASPKTKQTKPKLMKTSMRLPVDLWTETRIRAIREGRDAQDLVAEALAAYLKKGGSK
jgi:hypothetical protein